MRISLVDTAAHVASSSCAIERATEARGTRLCGTGIFADGGRDVRYSPSGCYGGPRRSRSADDIANCGGRWLSCASCDVEDGVQRSPRFVDAAVYHGFQFEHAVSFPRRSTGPAHAQSQDRTNIFHSQQQYPCALDKLMRTDDDLLRTLVLLYAIEKSDTICNAIVLCPYHSVSNKSTKVLDEFGAQISQVPHVARPWKKPPVKVPDRKLLQHDKPHLSNVTTYATAVFLGPDTIVIANIHNLHNSDEFCAAQDKCTPTSVSEVMAFKPNWTTFQKAFSLYVKLNLAIAGSINFSTLLG